MISKKKSIESLLPKAKKLKRKPLKISSPAAASDVQFRILVETMNEGALVLRKDGKMLFCNERFGEMTGKSIKKLLGESFIKLIPAGDRKEFLSFLKKSLKKSQTARLFLISRKNTLIPVQISARKLHTSGDETLGIVVTDLSDLSKVTENLIKSEVFYKSLIENSSDIKILLDKTGKMIFASPAVRKTLGYTEKEILKLDIFKFIHPDDLKNARKLIKDALKLPSLPVQFTFRIRKKDKGYIWVEGTAANFLDMPGVNGIICNFIDVTEKRAAHEELKKINRDLSLLYEAQKELSSTLDIFTIYNKVYEIVSKIMPSSGMSIASFDENEKLLKIMAFWQNGGRKDTDNIPAIKYNESGGIQSKVIRTAKPLVLNNYYQELLKSRVKYFISDDGSLSNNLPPENNISHSALLVPVITGGKVIGVIQVLSMQKNAYTAEHVRILEALSAQVAPATINARLYQQSQNEIDAKIKKEKELSDIRKNLEEAQRIAHLGSWTLELKTNTLYNSDEVYRILGLTPLKGNMDFETAMSFIFDEDRESTKNSIINAIHQKVSYVNESRIRRPDGGIRYVKVMGEPVFDENGNLTGMHGTIQDITDAKRIHNELMISISDKELMLKEIHHRVKNNLQVVSSLLRLQSDKIQDKAAAEYLKLSDQRVKSMALIHQQLYRTKDLGRISFGEYLNELCTYLLFSYDVSSSRVDLKINIEQIFFGIDTALPCGLIVNELLTNSIKHAFPEGRSGNIEISLTKDKDGINHLVVKDDGVGADDLSFTESSTLGIELVNTLTEQLDGKIEVTTAIGKGTEVKISFSDLFYKSTYTT